METSDSKESFYRDNTPEHVIRNLIVLSAMALAMLGHIQGACDYRDFIIQVINAVYKPTLEETKQYLYDKFGSRMQYDVTSRRLVHKDSRAVDTDTLVSVHKVTQLYHGKKSAKFKGDIIALLLAYFNFENAIPENHVQWVITSGGGNNLFFSLLYIIQCQFNPDLSYQLGDKYIYSLPFKGNPESGVECIELKHLANGLQFTLELKREDQTRLHAMKEVYLDLLSNIDEQVSGVKPSYMTQSMTAQGSKQISTSTRSIYKYAAIEDDRCDSSKKIFREHPYITFFIIAAAALLACGAIALTTYFHVGTNLMLAAGFIPFLNFVGGFQISLLLGIVTAATACAGVCVAVKKRSECCKPRCCDSEPFYGSDSQKIQ